MTEDADAPRLLTRSEAALVLRVSLRTLDRLIADRKLAVVRIAGLDRTLVELVELDRLIAASRAGRIRQLEKGGA